MYSKKDRSMVPLKGQAIYIVILGLLRAFVEILPEIRYRLHHNIKHPAALALAAVNLLGGLGLKVVPSRNYRHKNTLHSEQYIEVTT